MANELESVCRKKKQEEEAVSDGDIAEMALAHFQRTRLGSMRPPSYADGGQGKYRTGSVV